MIGKRGTKLLLCLILLALAGGVAYANPTTGTWEERATVNELVLATAFADPQTGLSVGAKNLIGPRILRTMDAGISWQSVLNTTPNLALTDITWQDGNTAFATGSGVKLFFNMNDAILKTDDRGTTWESVWNKGLFSYWTEIQVVSPDVVIATGDWTPFFYTYYGVAYSTDGGQTWEERKWNWNWDPMGTYAWPTDLHFLDENVGFLAGGVWPLAATAGVLGVPADERFAPDAGSAGDQWLAVAEVTTDGGQTWTTIFEQPGFTLTDINFVNRNEGWVTGYYETGCCVAHGWICHTTDGGLTWEQQFFGKENVAAIQAIHMFNRREGWVAGYEDNQATARTLLYHTTDGGETWAEMDFHPFADPFDLFFFNEGEGWTVGPNSAQMSKFLHYSDPERTPKVTVNVVNHPDTYTPGGNLTWTLNIQNVSGETQQGDLWLYLASPAIPAASPFPIPLAQGVTLPAGLNINPTLSLPLPAWMPAGVYNLETVIGPFGVDDPLTHLAYGSFDVTFIPNAAESNR